MGIFTPTMGRYILQNDEVIYVLSIGVVDIICIAMKRNRCAGITFNHTSAK